MTQVKAPRLLDSNFAEKARLSPESMSLSLQLRDTSYARITLAGDDEPVAMRDWMELFSAKGSAGLFRVTGMQRGSNMRRTLTLMHAIDTLSDDVWPEQTDYDGYTHLFLAALLSKQKTARWQLGTCADTSAYKRAGINYTKLSDLLHELLDAKPDYYLTYDFTTSPWTLNLMALPQTASAEFRLTRNVETAQVTRDDAEMCNRLYLSVNTATAGTPETYVTMDFEDYHDDYYLDPSAVETAGTGWKIMRHSFASSTTFRLVEIEGNPDVLGVLQLAYQKNSTNYPLGDTDLGHTFEADALLINYSTALDASAILSVSIAIPDADGEMKGNTEELQVYNNLTSQALYGIIEKTADIDMANVVSPADWAQRFLADRADPAIQITIDGFELSHLTGDSWDEFDRGRLVQVTLNDMGEIVTERVESVTYPDAIGEPERINVELANKLAKYSSALAKLQDEVKRNGRATRGLARNTDKEHLELIVSKIRKTLDETQITDIWESGIILDATSGVKIYSLYQGLQSNRAEINVQNNRITMAIQGVADANGAITAASIMLAINGDQSAAYINADKIYLNGSTKISDLFTISGSAVRLNISQLYADRVNINAQGDLQLFGYQATWGQKTVLTGVTLSDDRDFVYQTSSGTQHTIHGKIVTGGTVETIYYLNRGQPVS